MAKKYIDSQFIYHERGAASIFIVIFFALLIGVIGISFSRIATQDQDQATNSDLTQSAYDSAEAGIEDGTRALRNYQTKCINTPTPAASCTAMDAALALSAANPDACNVDGNGLSTTIDGKEVQVGSASDAALRQAYTCVVVATQTLDYMKTATADENYIIPLRSANNQKIAKVKINWFSSRDLNGASVTLPTSATDLPEGNAQWGSKTPPIMRTQLISFPRANIDTQALGRDARTLFLYPTSNLGSNPIDINGADGIARGEKTSAPTPVRCTPGGAFVCTAELSPLPIPNITSPDTDYFLRIGALYNNTDFQIVLYDAADNVIKFDNVEPTIDANGRANDVFRRVLQRIEYKSAGSDLARYGGFDITEGICKDFHISNRTKDYKHNCARSDLVDL